MPAQKGNIYLDEICLRQDSKHLKETHTQPTILLYWVLITCDYFLENWLNYLVEKH